MGAPKKPYRSKAQEQEFLAMLHFSQSNPKPERNLPTLSLHVKPHVHELQHRDILVHNEVDQVTSGSKHMKHAPSSESKYKKNASMNYKSGVYILHGKREIPAVVVIWTPGRLGVRCGSSSFRQAWSKHHRHGYKTHVYTLSLSSDLQGAKKNRNKAKRSRFKTHTKKTKISRKMRNPMRCT
jgi:hypothetical protein